MFNKIAIIVAIAIVTCAVLYFTPIDYLIALLIAVGTVWNTYVLLAAYGFKGACYESKELLMNVPLWQKVVGLVLTVLSYWLIIHFDLIASLVVCIISSIVTYGMLAIGFFDRTQRV